MSGATRLVLVVLAVVVAAATWSTRSGGATAPEAAPWPNPSGTFVVGARTAADREAVARSVAGARPEARALIERVDDFVAVLVGPTGPKAVGYASPSGVGRWTVSVDVATVAARYGQRGTDRLMLHELGHVIDGLLVDEALAARLDAGIPRGSGCDRGTSGACANREERFADTFAKWATGDLGFDLHLGYKIPPPEPSLDAWGAPLAALGNG